MESKFLTERSDYELCDRPQWMRIDEKRPGTFYIPGKVMMYRVVVDKNNKVDVYRRLKTFNGEKK